MNYVGFMLALLTGCVLLYATYSILTEYLHKKRTRISGPILPYVSEQTREALPENLLKGNAFEKFIVTKFSREYFHLIDWRSDKSYKGIFPAANSNPDMVYEYRHKETRIWFAVECKWRTSFLGDAIQWADRRKEGNYRAFRQERDIPVFVVIGVGGSPGDPQEMFVLPLDAIPYNMFYLSKNFLMPFSKKPGSNFYLDTRQLKLT